MNTQKSNGFTSAVQGPGANYLRVKWRRPRLPYGRSDSWMPVKVYHGAVWLSATANGRDEAIQREVSTVAVLYADGTSRGLHARAIQLVLAYPDESYRYLPCLGQKNQDLQH
ncbi:hypothetical protein OIDMADRAFT_60038 [Oidiodendron maius Zn]|uniref:Uncharacterized protein n=1 Tax=Oidiodendron maius (strain Zn) TaxID=913774 RepID=A0A0C3GFI0_OIDMZ|nr:hypothetical protein OIDMADRAFT_60038 [Oidiodendron maius Zn]